MFLTPPYLTFHSTGSVVIVTGANAGLIRKQPATCSLQVPKAEPCHPDCLERRRDGKPDTGVYRAHQGCIEVWELGLSFSSSVRALARKAQELERVDVPVVVAGEGVQRV